MYKINFKFVTFVFIVSMISTSVYAKEPEFIIGFPEDNMSNDWRAAQMREIQHELNKHKNVRFLMADAAGSIAKNILDIEDMVAQGVQVLFMGPKNPIAISPIAKNLRKKGIKIILLTRKLASEDYDVFISPDDYAIAYKAGKFLANKIHGKARILILEGVTTTTTAKRRTKGFLDSLNDTGIKVISAEANYSRTDAIAVIDDFLKKGKKFDAIYAHNDAMAAGARLALKKAGIDPASIPTVGIDFLPETREAIKKGEQLASFTYPTCGKVGVKAALALLKGQKVSRHISVPFQLVTKENVEKIKAIY